MLQIRSILDVADNTGAKKAAAIGVLGLNQMYACVGDVIKAHVKKAAPDGTVKKGDVVYDLGCGDGRIVVTAAKKYGVKAVG